jgi:hypothetical protein
MNKFAPFAVLATLATFSLVPVAVHAQTAAPKIVEGKMVYAANGQRLAPVYRVNADGSVQMIMEGRLVTVPATVLSEVNGKLTSSENKGELLR